MAKRLLVANRTRSEWGRSPAQAMVIAAIALAALLSFTALVLNVGMLLTERRHLQNAADAAALAGARQLADEQTSGSLRDARVHGSITTLLRENDVDLAGNRQLQAAYLDQSGTLLGGVGTGGQFPATAAGVQVAVSGPFPTILSGFVGQDTFQVQADARAGLRSVAFPSSLLAPAPLAVPRAAVQAGATYDLYDQAIAQAAHGVSGYRPFLDLAHASNSGSSYQAAASYGDPLVNLQYWSDGLHDSGQLGLGNQVSFASGNLSNPVLVGLLDNVRRQGFQDANGSPYALIDLPVWDSYVPGGAGGTDAIMIVGFVRFRILESEITSSSLRGSFVPYVVADPTAGTAANLLWGPNRLALLR